MISSKEYDKLHQQWQALEEAQRKQQHEPTPVKSVSPAAANTKSRK